MTERSRWEALAEVDSQQTIRVGVESRLGLEMLGREAMEIVVVCSDVQTVEPPSSRPAMRARYPPVTASAN